MLRRSTTVGRLEDHPNLCEVLGVLAQLAHIADADLPRLAAAWNNDAVIAEARDRALSTDAPLIVEVLSAFDAVRALFDDDLRGEAAYVTVDPSVTVTALKAVRDAIAGAYARPVLSRSDHAMLMRPWRTVFAAGAVAEPDLGPQGQAVKDLLGALPRLATRCHNTAAQADFDALVDQSFVDESDRAGARESAFQVAVLTSRRRIWALVGRTAAEALTRSCRACRAPRDAREDARVLQVCLDAVCVLLVADALPEELTLTLTRPVARLVPLQRDPSS